jgi:hypothetical protein
LKLTNNNHRINLKYKVGLRELFSITPSENIPSTAGYETGVQAENHQPAASS